MMPRAFLPWLLFIAAAFTLVAVFGVDVPREDDWFLPPLLADGALNLYNIFAPANEHRIALSRLISVALAYAAGWNVKLYMFVNVAAATATFLVVARIAWRQVPEGARGWGFHFANLVSCALVLSLAQHEAWLFGALMPWHLVNLLVVSGIALLASAAPARRLLAALCCTLASFSAAHGLLAWPALAPLLGGGRRIGAWLALGAATALLYFAGLGAGPAGTLAHSLSGADLRLPATVLALLGAAWTHDGLAATVVGAALVLALLFTVTGRERVAWSESAPWLALAAFSALSALAIAAGRMEMNAGVALTGRYVPATMLFSVAVVQLLRARIRGAAAAHPLFHAAAGALLCAAVLHSASTLDDAAAGARRLRHLGTCLAIYHQAPRNCLGHLHPSLDNMAREVAWVEARGLRRFERDLPFVADPAPAAGFIDTPGSGAAPVRLLRNRTGSTSVKLTGWAAVPGRQPARIVLFTYNGRQRFFTSAPVDRPRPDVAQARKQPSARLSGWEILIPAAILPPGEGTIQAWTWDRKGRRFLRLGGEVRVAVFE